MLVVCRVTAEFVTEFVWNEFAGLAWKELLGATTGPRENEAA
jgi:hypothetical protein